MARRSGPDFPTHYKRAPLLGCDLSGSISKSNALLRGGGRGRCARSILKPRRESSIVISLRQQGSGFAPFPVSPSGGKRGAPPPPLRYGSGKAPAQSRTLPAFWAGKEGGLELTGLRPGPRPSSWLNMKLYNTNRTDH